MRVQVHELGHDVDQIVELVRVDGIADLRIYVVQADVVLRYDVNILHEVAEYQLGLMLYSSDK